MEKQELRTDPLTGESFFPKKISQVFASSANRIKFNNQKASTIRQERAFIDKPVRKSHMVLRDLVGDEKEFTEKKDFFRGKGLSLFHFTEYREVGGKKYPCVYEYMIIPSGDNLTIKKL